MSDQKATVAAIKTATKQLVAALGGCDAAASATRVGRTQINEYSNRNSPQMIPVDVAAALDRCAEHPFVLAALAHAEGYGLLPLQIGHGDVAKDMENIATSAGELMAETIRVLADGLVSDDERHALLERLGRLQHFVSHATGTLRGMQPAAAPLRAVQTS